jgi:hypothetical protein
MSEVAFQNDLMKALMNLDKQSKTKPKKPKKAPKKECKKDEKDCNKDEKDIENIAPKKVGESISLSKLLEDVKNDSLEKEVIGGKKLETITDNVLTGGDISGGRVTKGDDAKTNTPKKGDDHSDSSDSSESESSDSESSSEYEEDLIAYEIDDDDLIPENVSRETDNILGEDINPDVLDNSSSLKKDLIERSNEEKIDTVIDKVSGDKESDDKSDNKNDDKVNDKSKRKKESEDSDDDDSSDELVESDSESEGEDSSSSSEGKSDEEDDEDDQNEEEIPDDVDGKRKEIQKTLENFFSENNMNYITGGSVIPTNRVKIIDAYPYIIRSFK